MKFFWTSLLFFFLVNQAHSQLNTSLVSNLPYSQSLNDIWGWVADDGTEYALVGTRTGVSIVSLAQPQTPVEKAFIPGPSSTWRDLKTWKDYAYVTNETGDGLLVIHLATLPDSVTYFYWQPVIDGLGQLSTCHNLYIDENGLCYLAGCNVNSGGVILIDVASNPAEPKYVGKARAQYSHDAYARNNLLYSSEVYGGTFSITDVTNRANPTLVAVQSTPFAFTHNAWLSDDGNVVFTTDERANAPVAAYDVSDFDNIKELDQIRPSNTIGQGVIPHNVHVFDDYLITSHYTDGVVIVDAARPDNLIEVGYYDTYLQPGTGFNGSWGAYPFLPSGLMLASDINNGLFVIRPNYQRACYLEGIVKDASNNALLSDVSISFNNQNERSKLDGSFKTGTVQAGAYEVTFSKFGYTPQTVTVNLNNGEVSNLEIRLVPLTSFTVLGQVVTSSNGAPVSGAKVVITNELTAYTVTTNNDGRFSLNNVITGDYQIVAGAWGYLHRVVADTTINQNQTYVIELELGYQDDFILDLGWSQEGTASSGKWERGIPQGTNFNGIISNTNSDVDTDLGNQCYVTGNGGGNAGDDDVDNGNVQLISPVMDLKSYQNPILTYNYWFLNAGGDGNPNDFFKVTLSNGINQVTLDLVSTSFSQWRNSEVFALKDYLPLTQSMQIIFETSDQLPGHLVEAAVDAFSVIDDLSSNDDNITEENQLLTIFPNPFTNNFTITLPDVLSNEPRNFSVFDIFGRQIYTLTTTDAQFEVNLSHLPNGIYWVQMYEGQQLRATQKLVKQ